MNRRVLLASGLAMAICGGAYAQPLATPVPPNPPPGAELLEPIYGVWATTTGLTIRVLSHGCTASTEFAFYVDRRTDGANVSFARKRLDRCRRASGPIDLAFSFAELGLSPGTAVTVLNPLSASPKPY
jgi:hypothetical protein